LLLENPRGFEQHEQKQPSGDRFPSMLLGRTSPAVDEGVDGRIAIGWPAAERSEAPGPTGWGIVSLYPRRPCGLAPIGEKTGA